MDKPILAFNSSITPRPSLSVNLSILNLLRPAGTQLLIEEDETTFFDYMRLTFSDLILKRVMEVEVVRRKAHHRDKRSQSYFMIKPGSNFNFYKPAPFEKIFLNELNMQGSVLLKSFIENVFNESPRDNPYKKRLVTELKLQSYFNTGLAFHLFSKVNLNELGTAFKNEIHAYLKETDSGIADWVKNDKDKVMEVLSVLGGNIFLLPSMDKKLWNDICTLAKQHVHSEKITISKAADLQELSPTYFSADIYPIVSYFYERVEKLVGYNGVFSGVREGTYDI